MKRLRSFAGLLPMTVLLTGCKDDIVGSGFSLNVDERVVVTGRFENEEGLATIVDLRVTWDGDALQQVVASTPLSQVTVSGTKYGPQRGSHRLSFQIVGQTSSANVYRVSASRVTAYGADGGVERTLELEPRSALLHTNSAITYDVRL